VKRKTLFLLLSIAVLASTAGACKKREPENRFRFSGTLEMTEHSVGFPVSGRIAQLFVDEGDEVKAGQLLASLERFPLAQREHRRLSGLLRGGGTNEQVVEQSELAMLDQRALSPVTGVVLTKVHDTGEVVGPSSPLLIIGDRSELWVRIFVPEGLINRVKMGQAATLRFDGLRDTLGGKIGYISPQAEFTPRNVQTPEERVTQTFAVKVYLEQPPNFIRPGVAADVFLELP
jgi:HlyD family secretion protein